jgi:hypothetical protein
MIKELKFKKTKLGAVITAIESPDEPTITAISKWVDSAGLVIVHGPLQPKNPFPAGVHGSAYVGHKAVPVLFKSVLGEYLMRVRGDGLLAFCGPKIGLKADFSGIYHFADSNRMERAYGFFATEGAVPYFFCFSGAMLEHLYHACPPNLNMCSPEWAVWLDGWAKKSMMKHRYFDASSFGIAWLPKPLDIPIEEVPEPVVEKPVKKKKK